MASANAIVSGPTLPINIRMVIKILPIGLNSEVKSALSPTVAKAETVSNNISDISVSFSVIVNKKKIVKMKIIPEAETYIVKPKDGADSIGIEFITKDQLSKKVNSDSKNMLIQPFINF